MTDNALLAVYQQWIDALNAHDPSIIDRLYSPDFVEHNPPASLPTDADYLQLLKSGFERMFSNVPDYRIELLNSVVQGDQVAFYQVITGTHQGTIMNTPATGNAIRLLESGIVRIENGLFVERWLLQDRLGLAQQIGAQV